MRHKGTLSYQNHFEVLSEEMEDGMHPGACEGSAARVNRTKLKVYWNHGKSIAASRKALNEMKTPSKLDWTLGG